MYVKDSQGAHSWPSYFALWPYSYGSRFISAARRKWSKEPLHTKICEGWYIGGWPASDAQLPSPDCAVLDCILELPRRVTVPHYCTTPVWDTCGFTVEQLKQGAEWAVSQRNEGRLVYVHCAYGHGRSCTMLSACLAEAKIFPNFVAAFRHISSLRPRVYINARQKGPIMEWSRLRGDTLPDDIDTMPRVQPPEMSRTSLQH